MEPLAFVADRFKEFSRSTEKFVNEVWQRCQKRASQSPIEILKRLQREAFSDLMKLRERQDKLERLLSFYQSGKGGPFQEPRTHMKGIINADGAFMFLENNHQQVSDNLDRVGRRRRGVDLRFIFETSIRQRDLLIAEFLASHCTIFSHSSNNGSSPLALSKLVYFANICDSLSAVFVPLGAKCTEFGTTRFQQGGYESMPSSFSPPLFHQSESCGLGFIVKRSNLAVSLAGLASRSGKETSFAGDLEPSIFAEVSYKPSEEARLTMSGMWQTCKPSQLPKLGPMAAPGIRKGLELNTSSSVALMVESQFDESNIVGCWVEMWKCSPSLLEWSASLSDVGGDEVGWGLRLGGRTEGSFNHIWMEGFLSFSLGKKAVLQPGILYAVGGECRTPALLLRSSWFM